MQLKGKRVRLTMDLPTLVEATVVDESENGVVLDIDVDTAVVSASDSKDHQIIERYLHRHAPDAQHPVWLGRAHLDRVQVLS